MHDKTYHCYNKCMPCYMRPQLFLLYSLIIHSSMNFFNNTPGSLYSLFSKSSRLGKLFFHSFNMAKPANIFANFPVKKQPSTFEVIRRYRAWFGSSSYFQYWRFWTNYTFQMLFPNCYYKQGIQSNLPSYTPMNQGPICAKVYPEGIQPIKGNNCGLIPCYM